MGTQYLIHENTNDNKKDKSHMAQKTCVRKDHRHMSTTQIVSIVSQITNVLGHLKPLKFRYKIP
jgi:hypothetical protein